MSNPWDILREACALNRRQLSKPGPAEVTLVWHEDDDGTGGWIAKLTSPGGTMLMNPIRWLQLEASIAGRPLSDEDAREAFEAWAAATVADSKP